MKTKLVAGLCAALLLGGAAGGFFAGRKMNRLKTERDTLAYQLETANAMKTKLEAELETFIHPVVQIDVKQLEKEIGFITAFTARMADAAVCPVSRTIPDKIKKELDEYLYRKRKNA